MFVGAIPEPLRAVLAETVASWPVSSLYVGCSGNFTVERVCHRPGLTLHGNDISLYSCAMGSHLLGERLPVTIKDPEYAWLEPYIEDSAGLVATLMLCTDMLDGYGRTGRWFDRQRHAYRSQWDALYGKTLITLLKAGEDVRLESFVPGDCVAFIESAPPEAAIVTFPPTYRGGYERLYRGIDAVFGWEPPTYPMFDDASLERLLEAVQAHAYWMVARDEELEPLAPFAVGRVQPTPRAKPLHIYASQGPKRLVIPQQKVEPVPVARLGLGDLIPRTAQLRLAQLTTGQLNTLRAEYLGPHIAPATPSWAFAVLVDQLLIGALAFSPSKWGSIDDIYMMTDLAVGPTDYARISKLVLYAALSVEAREALQSARGAICLQVSTTAFTDRPVSMKYRGLFDLQSRKPGMLNYAGDLGRWTLQEGLAEWLKRHGSTRPSPTD